MLHIQDQINNKVIKKNALKLRNALKDINISVFWASHDIS